jgi:hypothetical protein
MFGAALRVASQRRAEIVPIWIGSRLNPAGRSAPYEVFGYQDEKNPFFTIPAWQ